MEHNGMKLMSDTGSLTNFLMANASGKQIHVGDTVARLMWSDRDLYIVKAVGKNYVDVTQVKVRMKDWTDGTEYPVLDENGNMIEAGTVTRWFKGRKYWNDGRKGREGRIHLCWGAKTGYRDPSF